MWLFRLVSPTLASMRSILVTVCIKLIFKATPQLVNGGAGSADIRFFNGLGRARSIISARHYGLGCHLRRLANCPAVLRSAPSANPRFRFWHGHEDQWDQFTIFWATNSSVAVESSINLQTGRHSSPTRWSAAPISLEIPIGRAIRSVSTACVHHKPSFEREWRFSANILGEYQFTDLDQDKIAAGDFRRVTTT